MPVYAIEQYVYMARRSFVPFSNNEETEKYKSLLIRAYGLFGILRIRKRKLPVKNGAPK